jgi:2-C-methyl-D-erythritol 4-phosphate cytidylyltransferase
MPMLYWSVAAAAAAASVEAVVIAAPAGHLEEAREVGSEAAGGAATVTAVEGGRERADSVGTALAQVTTPIVAVHDAARPLVSAEAFDALADIVAAGAADGAILATPIFDTIKRAEAPAADLHPPIAETVDRSSLWAAQTPQAFATETLRSAYEAAGARASMATDEAMLIEWAGGTVLLVPGSGPNFKLTSADDLRVAEALLGDSPRGGDSPR